MKIFSKIISATLLLSCLLLCACKPRVSVSYTDQYAADAYRSYKQSNTSATLSQVRYAVISQTNLEALNAYIAEHPDDFNDCSSEQLSYLQELRYIIELTVIDSPAASEKKVELYYFSQSGYDFTSLLGEIAFLPRLTEYSSDLSPADTDKIKSYYGLN